MIAESTETTTERTGVCRVPGCERPMDPESAGGLEWCAEHHADYDARAELEAWEMAHEILAP